MGKHYSKEVTAVILADHAKGATAEETQKHLQDIYQIAPSLNTIYAHRRSITAEQLVDELQRQQERDITKETNSEIRMKYRNELLKMLLPIKAEIISKSISINKTSVEVNVAGLLAEYEDLFESADIRADSTIKQVYPSQAHEEAGSIPIT